MRLVTEKEDGKKYAMKVIERKKLPGVVGKKMVNEVEILKDLHHPNIIQFREIIDSPKEKFVYLIM